MTYFGFDVSFLIDSMLTLPHTSRGRVALDAHGHVFDNAFALADEIAVIARGYGILLRSPGDAANRKTGKTKAERWLSEFHGIIVPNRR